jgi:hypothetical protein
MSSSYETWEESATQDKRKGRRTALATSDDLLENAIAPATFYKVRHQRPDRLITVLMGANHHRWIALSSDAATRSTVFGANFGGFMRGKSP